MNLAYLNKRNQTRPSVETTSPARYDGDQTTQNSVPDCQVICMKLRLFQRQFWHAVLILCLAATVRSAQVQGAESADKPNVLLIGDSISIGYTPIVQGMLADVANVTRPLNANGGYLNCEGTTRGVAMIDEWLSKSEWDVIHFNFGLHDLKHVDARTGRNSNNPLDPQQADPETYEANLEAIVGRLKQTNAVLVFATTTPYPDTPGGPLRRSNQVAVYNAAAERVMRRHGIEVHDLHGLVQPRMSELLLPNNVHFTANGSRFLAECVTNVIRRQLAAGSQPSAGTRRPNILWLVGENMKLDLGIYGARNVHTPNLDGLASQGQRYTRVFSTSPVCAPSRSAFMVGMYQTTTDMHHMRSHRDDDYRLPEGVRPLTHRLQDAGYFTANIKQIGDREVGTGKLDLNFVNEGDIYQSDDWTKLKSNQPFFAQINMPESEYDIYDRQTWKHPRVKWYGEQQHPQIANEDNVTPPPYYPDHPVVRKEWARYLNSISGMDIRIGWILEQLNLDGLADDTIVVFFGDNGRMEPRGIHWIWDTGIHVPLFVHYPANVPPPKGYTPGRVVDDVISLLDITATTLDMAGIAIPDTMQSRSFLGPNSLSSRQYAFSARDRIDETVLHMRSVRGKRFHYIRNYSEGEGFATLNRYKEKCFMIKPLMREMLAAGQLTGPSWQLMQPMPYESLYDTQADPHEVNNLVDSAQHQQVLAEMRAALSTWEIETGDLGAIPEPAEVVAPFEKEMHDWFGTPAWVGGDNKD